MSRALNAIGIAMKRKHHCAFCDESITVSDQLIYCYDKKCSTMQGVRLRRLVKTIFILLGIMLFSSLIVAFATNVFETKKYHYGRQMAN